jgi:uncharacterized protein DUF2635
MTTEPPRFVVKPAPGRLVRHPRSFRPIREEGEDVTSERSYFHRMLRAGDVVVVPQHPKPAKED